MPAQSEKQRKFMAYVYTAKKKGKKLKGKAKDAAKSMNLSQLRDFMSTKETGLIKEAYIQGYLHKGTAR
jgi:hypothetical protein